MITALPKSGLTLLRPISGVFEDVRRHARERWPARFRALLFLESGRRCRRDVVLSRRTLAAVFARLLVQVAWEIKEE